ILEHYPGMAEAEIARHVEEAHARWPLFGVTVIHRHGRLTPGEVIVLVVTASSHRGAAFAAAAFLMDYLKTRAPFWKRVETADGTAWVDAKAADDAPAERWAAAPGGRRGAGALGDAAGGARETREITRTDKPAALRSQTLLSWNAAPPNGAIASEP